MFDFRSVRLYQLNKQKLTQKVSSDTYPDILNNHLGLHSTDYVTPYLSLWARVSNFEPGEFLDDLNSHRNSLRMKAFRGTVFVVHKDNLRDIIGGTQQFNASKIAEFLRFGSKEGKDFELLGKKISVLLSGEKRLTAREIKKELSGHMEGKYFSLVLRYLELQGILARTGQRYITDPVIRYGLMNEWIPELDMKQQNPEMAIGKLILKYIRIFGPVCLEDICWWLPIQKTIAKKIILGMKKKLCFVDFNNREYMMESSDHDQLQNFKHPIKSEPVITFLPYEDHFPKAYIVRNWFVSEETTPVVFHVERLEYGQLRPSILIDGEIVGRWEMKWNEKKKLSMTVEIIDINKNFTRTREMSTLIERKRNTLEMFVNEKLVPLMKR